MNSAIVIARDYRIPPAALRLYVLLSATGAPQHWVSATYARMARALGMDSSTVRRSVAVLAQLGYIERRPVAGRRYRYSYRITMSPALASVPVQLQKGAPGDVVNPPSARTYPHKEYSTYGG